MRILSTALFSLLFSLLALSCGEPPQAQEPDTPLFQEAFDTAEEVYFSGRYDSAQVLLSRIRKEARGRGRSDSQNTAALAAEARAITWMGLAAWRLGDYQAAANLAEEALSLKLEHGLKDQLFRSYNALGLLAWNENRLSEARAHYQNAIAAAEDNDKALEMASATGNLALVQTELGAFEEARLGFQTMRSIAAELGELRIEGNALTNLGMLEIRTGNADAAPAYLDEARIRYDSIGYPTGVLSVLGQLGSAYMALGEPRQAFAVLDSALVLAREQGLRQEEASNLEILAELYREAGDFRRALTLYEKAKAINNELGLDVETGADLRGEAQIQAHLGNLFEAHSLAREALHIHREAGARLDELFDLLLLAEIQNEMEASAAVRSTLFQARRLAEALDARIARTELALTEARIADAAEDHQSVLDLTEAAGRDLSRGGFSGEWEAHLLRSRAFRNLGQADSALVAGRRALAAVERVRTGFGSNILRTTYASDKGEAYAHLVSLLLEKERVEEAFSVSDAARGRALMEHLTVVDVPDQGRNTASDLQKSETLLREIAQLVESVDYLEDFPFAERTPGQNGEQGRLYGMIDSLRVVYSELTVRSAEVDQASATLLGSAPTSAGDVRDALGPGQILVEYLVTPGDSLLIFVLTSRETRHARVPIDEGSLASRVRLARGLLTQDPVRGHRARGVLSGLYEILIQPVLGIPAGDGETELLIVPNGVLSYLPFSALFNASTQRYLAQDYLIRVLPSAGALAALRMRRATSISTPEAAHVLAPFPRDLPSTVEEAQAVNREFPNTRRYLGNDATEGRLRRALETEDVVHVATHGALNARNPMFSRLELAPGRGGGSDDGRFEVHELFGTSVASPLVFLSGCETGTGVSGTTRFDEGEDIATLSQAFLYAGARNVIATLWPIDDARAAVFTQEFYRALDEGSPSRALAAAQRSLLGTEEMADPFYWAAYQISGDDFFERTDRVAAARPGEAEAHKPKAVAVQYQ